MDSDVGKTELAIFESSKIQTSVESGIFQDIHTQTAIDRSTTVIDFIINGSKTEYLDLNDTLLSLRLHLEKTDGSKFTQNDASQPIPVNYFMNALFSAVSLEFNDVTIEGNSSKTYPFKATIEQALNFDDDTKRIQLLPAGVSHDEAERAKWGANSRVFELVGALRLDFLTQPKYIIPGVDVRIRLTLSSAAFALQKPTTSPAAGGGGDDARIQIDQCILYVRRVKVNPSVELGHTAGLSKQNAIYPYMKSKTICYSIPYGTQLYMKENLFSVSQLPKFVAVCMVRADAFNGSLDHSPFHFEHFGANQVTLYRDGQTVPYKRGYTQTFRANNNIFADTYVRSILQSTQMLNNNRNNGIDMLDFLEKGYCFFNFNLTPDFDMFVPQQLANGNLRLEIRFSKALQQAINVIVYGLFDAQIEITSDRQIITDAHL